WEADWQDDDDDDLPSFLKPATSSFVFDPASTRAPASTSGFSASSQAGPATLSFTHCGPSTHNHAHTTGPSTLSYTHGHASPLASSSTYISSLTSSSTSASMAQSSANGPSRIIRKANPAPQKGLQIPKFSSNIWRRY
ncbi:hypothetical protein B0H17DRAFT_1147808, partial [Mycena rosella]